MEVEKLERMLGDRISKKDEIQKLQFELVALENNVKRTLISGGMVDFLTVNWNLLHRKVQVPQPKNQKVKKIRR